MSFPVPCNLSADRQCTCHLWGTGSSHCRKKRVLHQLEETASPQRLGDLHKGWLPMERGIRALPPHSNGLTMDHGPCFRPQWLTEICTGPKK